jgi:hypothetical protein
MNVSNKTTRTFTIFDVTEDQANDLLAITKEISNCEDAENYYTLEQMETVNNLRQALLNAGVKRKGADK